MEPFAGVVPMPGISIALRYGSDRRNVGFAVSGCQVLAMCVLAPDGETAITDAGIFWDWMHDGRTSV